MRSLLNPFAHWRSFRQLLNWTLLVLPVAILSGSASAFFLWWLERVTELRWAHAWLLFLLPAAGVVIAFLYDRFGSSAAGGNNLIMEEIHAPGGGVPARMAPLVLLGTLLTHLFGGSAGREGTAIQMGGSLAAAWGRLVRISPENQRVLLMAGVAAGFGSVFGTPLTGAIFAMEVLVIGRVQYEALIPVLVASLVGDATCAAWGIKHTLYHISFSATTADHRLLDGWLLAKVVVAAMAFGLASQLFSELTHSLQDGFKKFVPHVLLRPVAGALLVIGLVYLLGTRDYLGLGVQSPVPGGVTILSAFQPGGATPWSWWWKTLFTAITLSSGFKGGEVTPLFFVGAALGNALAVVFHAPVELFAGLGFIAVFAGATNTPLACTIMGIELFGSHYSVYFAVACFVAYFFSGHSGIYGAQRLGVPKQDGEGLPTDLSLKEVRAIDAEVDRMELARLGDRLSFRSDPGGPLPSIPMKPHHKITTKEMGKVRIYVTPRERAKAGGLLGKWGAKPLYREIINAAKADGIGNAMAFMTHYGFSNNGAVHAEGAENTNPNLTLCIELIDHKDTLETFCRKHGAMLQGKTIVYKHVEHWDVHGHHIEEEDLSPDTVVGEDDKQPLA